MTPKPSDTRIWSQATYTAGEMVAVTEQYQANWKNYYQILQVSPDAKPGEITAAYRRLARLYSQLLSERPQESQSFSMRMTDIYQAYQVLSDSPRRAAYHQVFKAEYDTQDIEAEEPTTEQIVDSIALVAEEVSQRKVTKQWRVPDWSRQALRPVAIAIVSLLLIIVGGGSFAFAKPEHVLATPFRGVAVTMAEASHAAVSLIEDIRGLLATYERNIISTTLQSMRVIEGLRVVPAVTVATNDMASFPSAEYCLFPDYLDRRFSQFQYTVDSNGTVTVDASTATTDVFLKKIEQILKELTAGK